MSDSEQVEPRIHRAARRGDIDILQRLVDDGADVNEAWYPEAGHGAFREGVTPLMVAASSSEGASTRTLRWLLDHGADIGAVSKGGVSAGWYAAGGGGSRGPGALAGGDVDRLRLLFDAGADPAEVAENGRSVLSEACRTGDSDRVALVLERGVDPLGFRPTERRPYDVPLFNAAASGSVRTVDLLLAAGTPVDSADEQGATALMQAGSVGVARVLLDAGAAVNAVNRRDGTDALGATIGRFGSKTRGMAAIEVADLLLEHGAELDLGRWSGQPPHRWTRVREAVFCNDFVAFKYLIERGAQQTLPGEDWSLLHSAVWQYGEGTADTARSLDAIVGQLVHNGGDVNAADDRGRTPMHEAVGGDGRNQAAVDCLIEHSATADPADHDGVTPLMHIFDVADHPPDEQTINIVSTLMQRGADPNREDRSGRSAFDRAQAIPELLNILGGPHE